MKLNKVKKIKFVRFAVCIGILGICCVFAICVNYIKMKESTKMHINVAGFDMEYELKDRKLNISDFEKIKLGYSSS